jgi:peptidoglycan/xylan/chitin deacetylase (PgdA/CDA1 family)
MRILKIAVAFAWYYLGATRLVFFLVERITGKKLVVVFTYHRVVDHDSDEKYFFNYDRGEDFRAFGKQIDGIKRYFDCISLDHFVDIVTGKKAPARHVALITFDDADSEFSRYSLAILQERHCPAVVFAPTSFVSTDKRFWHLRISNAMKNVNESKWEALKSSVDKLPEPIGRIVANGRVGDFGGKRETCIRLVQALDRLTQAEIDECVEVFESVAGTEYNLGIRCMNWEELKALKESSIDVESHTVNHPRLSKCSDNAIKLELQEASTILAEKTGRPIRAICYPSGDFDARVVRTACDLGYEVGFTTLPGTNDYPLEEAEMLKIKRVSLHGSSEYGIELSLGKIALKRLIFGSRWKK